jgi:aconitate hydratase
MQNGLGVLGWGVGGIEAEAAMLGQPISMLIPKVVGFRLTGELPSGATATDLVLTITEMLRKHGVVGKFVEFTGEGVAAVPVANRATIGNMSPEFGSTCAIFPIDQNTLDYLRLTGRPQEKLDLVEAYAKEQGLWHDPQREIRYSEELSLDLSTVVPSIAGPKRPQDRIALADAKQAFRDALPNYVTKPPWTTAWPAPSRPPTRWPPATAPAPRTRSRSPSRTARRPPSITAPWSSPRSRPAPTRPTRASWSAPHCWPRTRSTGAWPASPGSRPRWRRAPRCHGLLRARRAAALPGQARLQPGRLRLHHLHRQLRTAAARDQRGGERQRPGRDGRAVGNRNFEGRINPDVKMNYLASPPLVVAYALAGTMDIDLRREPLGSDAEGKPVYLADIWPSPEEVADVVQHAVAEEMFTRDYADVFKGDDNWRGLDIPSGDTFAWDEASTYVRRPPYFDGMPAEPEPVTDIVGAKVLAKLGDSVTTDHISPAGAIKTDSPAGTYLTEHGVERRDFNSYGSRRGNHEVMIRGTFANIRLRNQLAPGTEGGVTAKDGEQMSIYDASRQYIDEGTPLIVLGGKEYGSGSSRDWAAKGTLLLGVRAVLVESFERIHRSNLIGMGVLPLQYRPGESAASLGLTGEETFDIRGIEEINSGNVPNEVTVTAGDKEFRAAVRIDTPGEADYYRHGGIMQYVLRSLR